MWDDIINKSGKYIWDYSEIYNKYRKGHGIVLDGIHIEHGFFPFEYIVGVTTRNMIQEGKHNLRIIEMQVIPTRIDFYSTLEKDIISISLSDIDDSRNDVQEYLQEALQGFLSKYDELGKVVVTQLDIPSKWSNPSQAYESIYIYDIELDKDAADQYLEDVKQQAERDVLQSSYTLERGVEKTQSEIEKKYSEFGKIEIRKGDIEQWGPLHLFKTFIFLLLLDGKYIIEEINISPVYGCSLDENTPHNFGGHLLDDTLVLKKKEAESKVVSLMGNKVTEEYIMQVINDYKILEDNPRKVELDINTQQKLIGIRVLRDIPAGMLPHEIKAKYPHGEIISTTNKGKTVGIKCVEKLFFKKQKTSL
ncbi:hypothetical protein LAT59_00055 [Candidatus Gracilibacteria bacterium]|nr:hypothetical protein [Candidatus Gracilibacteria bacterium]